jgi:hypothetical protein
MTTVPCRHIHKAAISIGLACPSKKNHLCQYLWDFLWTSSDITESPKAVSKRFFSDVTGSLLFGGFSCLGTPDLCIPMYL